MNESKEKFNELDISASLKLKFLSFDLPKISGKYIGKNSDSSKLIRRIIKFEQTQYVSRFCREDFNNVIKVSCLFFVILAYFSLNNSTRVNILEYS